MKKKFLVVLLFIVVIFSFVSCGKKKNTEVKASAPIEVVKTEQVTQPEPEKTVAVLESAVAPITEEITVLKEETTAVAETVAEEVEDTVEEIVAEVEPVVEQVVAEVVETVEEIEPVVEQVVAEVVETVEEIEPVVEQVVAEVVETVEDVEPVVEQVVAEVVETVEEIEPVVEQVVAEVVEAVEEIEPVAEQVVAEVVAQPEKDVQRVTNGVRYTFTPANLMCGYDKAVYGLGVELAYECKIQEAFAISPALIYNIYFSKENVVEYIADHAFVVDLLAYGNISDKCLFFAGFGAGVNLFVEGKNVECDGMGRIQMGFQYEFNDTLALRVSSAAQFTWNKNADKNDFQPVKVGVQVKF